MQPNVAVTYAFTMMPNTGFYLSNACVNSYGHITYDLYTFAGNCQSSTYCNMTNVQQSAYIRSGYDSINGKFTFVRTCSLAIDPIADKKAFMILSFNGSASCNVQWKVKPFNLGNGGDYGPIQMRAEDECPTPAVTPDDNNSNDNGSNTQMWVYVSVFAILPSACIFFFVLKMLLTSGCPKGAREGGGGPGAAEGTSTLRKCINVREACSASCDSCLQHKANGNAHCYCYRCHKKWDCHLELSRTAKASVAADEEPTPQSASRDFISLATDANDSISPLWGQQGPRSTSTTAAAAAVVAASPATPVAISYAVVPVNSNRGGYPEASAPMMSKSAYDPNDMD
jgi:hypothetical protein